MAPRAGRSVAVRQFHRGSLRVLRPHYLDASGQVTYAVVNPGGGYLDGDRYRTNLALEPGADLLLTTQSATKVYRSPRDHTLQETDVRLGADSRLEYLPDQLIAYRDARYDQVTRVAMEPSASLVPVVVDNLLLEPGAHGLDGLGFFEGYTHVGSLLVIDPRADDAALADVRTLLTERSGHLRAGATATPVPGMAVRVLGRSTPEVSEAIEAVGNLLRERWFGQGAVNLRKY
ncbi:MAG: urease accessory protein [Kocuria rhizophila]|nr:MAG: urease accessory protein [Kocuria rhizophila]